MIENHWDKIDCEYAVSEGGTTLVKDGRVVYVAIATTEKNPRVIRLVAHGSAGHGSIPRLDNPIEHLGAAVGKLLDWQPPMKLNDTTRVFFSQIEKVSDDPQLKRAAAYLGSPETQRFLAQKYPEYYSMLRTSVVPTVFQSGFRTKTSTPCCRSCAN
jgi:acetylornithine deacetylase/succinyl-diaminopimelate desuccinylase-like protein